MPELTKVSFSIHRLFMPAHTDEQFEEWAKSATGVIFKMSNDNPLANCDIGSYLLKRSSRIGGEQSPAVLAALLNLIEAVKLDNQERPQFRDAESNMPLDPLPTIPSDAPKEGSTWRHWKGKHVKVLGCGHHSESGEILVFYVETNRLPPAPLYARPITMWSDITRSGEHRFEQT